MSTPRENTNVTVRPEAAGDAAAVFGVNARAFDTEAEARLVGALQRGRRLVISLVATFEDRIVGHILFSPVQVETNPAQKQVWGLGPMAVLPGVQRRGIGTRLVDHGLGRCRESGGDGVVVLGHKEYYPRFGFVPAARFGLRFKEEAFDPYFMARELRPGGLADLGGLVGYPPEFDEV